jgi:O-antigen/teichoic acid export membrane protein
VLDAPSAADSVVESASPPPLRSHFVVLTRQSIVYGLGGVALQAVGLVTFPVLARVFAPRDYGLLEVTTAASTVLLTVVDAGMVSAAQRSWYDHADERARSRRSVLATAFVFTSACAALAAVAGVLGRAPISGWFFGSRDHGLLVALAAVSIPVANAAGFLRQAMRLRFRAWHFAFSTTLAAVAGGAAVVLAVTWLDAGVSGVVAGLLVGQSLGLAYGLVVVAADLRGRLSGSELRTMVAYGLPLIPTALAMWALMLVDRLMLGRLSSLGQVGEYAAANRIASPILLATTAFATAYGPYALSLYTRDRALERTVRSRILTYLTAGLTLAGLTLTLFARELLGLLAPGYETAYEAVGPVVLGGVALGLAGVVMAGISFARRTVWFAGLTVAAAAVNIGLNLVLIPTLEMVGAAIATAVAFALLTSAYYAVSQRLYPTPYDRGRVLSIVAVGVALGPVGLLKLDSRAVESVAKAGALLFFFVALWTLGILRARDLGRLRRVLVGVLGTREARA